MFYGDGNINIKENSYIGGYSTLQAEKGSNINIGKNCKISHNVRMYTKTAYSDQKFSKDISMKSYSKDINIGDGVWIGVNTYIGPGCNIGENSIVGANSVVTKDIMPNSIYGGVPAKFIRYKKDEYKQNKGVI